MGEKLMCRREWLQGSVSLQHPQTWYSALMYSWTSITISEEKLINHNFIAEIFLPASLLPCWEGCNYVGKNSSTLNLSLWKNLFQTDILISVLTQMQKSQVYSQLC